MLSSDLYTTTSLKHYLFHFFSIKCTAFVYPAVLLTTITLLLGLVHTTHFQMHDSEQEIGKTVTEISGVHTQILVPKCHLAFQLKCALALARSIGATISMCFLVSVQTVQLSMWFCHLCVWDMKSDCIADKCNRELK